MIRKMIIKTLVFLLVVIGSAFLVNKINNLNMDSVSREMEEPVLPVVYCEYSGQVINCMRGYTQTMATGRMRDNIIPITTDKMVTLLVEDADSYGASYSYELRSIAGDSLIEDGELSRVGGDNTYDKYQIQFRMDMQENQEYVLVFIITDEKGQKARYYTRVVELEEEYIMKVLQYATEFHNTTLNKSTDYEQKNIVLEALKNGDNVPEKGLAHVNLNSSYDLVSWGNLNPIIVTGIVPAVTELDSNYVVIHFEYIVETFEDMLSHFYNVDEYYSAYYNKNTGEVELLAFDREMESIFDERMLSKARNSISLGISDIEEDEFLTSENQKKIAFVSEGQLWEYDYSNSNLISVFNLMQGNYLNVKAVNKNNDTNILNIDDEGNLFFLTYGYMNRGIHEGKNGLALYYFDAKKFTVEEKFFVESDEPFAVMKQEVGRFSYYDENGFLYYLLDDSIYEVNLNDMTQRVMVSNLPSDKYIVSNDKTVVAYPNAKKEEEVTGIYVHNFATEEEYVAQGTDTDRFLALGFVGNDLIYGKADVSDIAIASNGEAIMPLYKLFIMSPQGEQLKEYSKTGIYIMRTDVQQDKIYLERATKQNHFFAETDADYISFKPEEKKDMVVMQYAYDDYGRKVVDIKLPSNMYMSENSNPIITKHKESPNSVEISVKTTSNEDAFYVFDNSGYVGEYKSAGKAITSVRNLDAGLVINAKGNTIYRFLEATAYNTVADSIDEYPCTNVEDTKMTCAYMCAHYLEKTISYQDVMAFSDWESVFEEYYIGVGVNISGVDLKTALYFLDRDIPFAASIGEDGRYVLVISYNSTHIRYYDPILDEEVKLTRKEFEELLSMQGNTMYTYSLQ